MIAAKGSLFYRKNRPKRIHYNRIVPVTTNRVTTVITSIHAVAKSAENVTINSVVWSVDNGTLTLSAAVPATVKIGDTITDVAGNNYLITATSGSDLTAQDFDSATDPATGAATIQNAYNSIQGFSTDLSDTIIYLSGDIVKGECYDDGGNFDESVSFTDENNQTSITLTVPTAERHDGTAGTGARIVRTSGTSYILTSTQASNDPDLVFEWLELDVNGGENENIVFLRGNNGTTAYAKNLIVHDMTNSYGNNMSCITFNYKLYSI